jgi:hypothetical protein
MTEQEEGAAALLRRANATIAALTRAARTDGHEISEPARKAFMKSFETEHRCRHCGTVTIDQSLPPEQRARAARAAMSAHFRRLAAVAVAARGATRRLDDIAREAETQLDSELGELDARC